MRTETIIKLLRVLGKLCIVFGVIGLLLEIYYWGDAYLDTGQALLLISFSILSSILSFITYSAMANMMEAIDSIAQTNKRVAEALERQSISSLRTDNYNLPPM